MMKLYYGAGACSMASHITLEETGAPYDTYSVNMAQREHKSPEYIKVHPHGKVPALDVDGKIIIENVAIQYYLAKQFPAASLAPKNVADEAQWISTNAWFSNTVHPSFGRWNRPMNFTPDEAAHDKIKELGKQAFWENLQEIDRRLEGREWMVGSQYTTSDPYALVFYGWGMRPNLPLKELKNFTAHKDRMLKRPAVRKILEREKSPILTY
jgi:glutathione S-transferase